MGCSYEEAKVRWYISNLLRTKDLSPKVMELVVDWAQDKADIFGFDETEMENAGKAENPEANLRRQEIFLAGLGKHPSRFGTATKSPVEKMLRKVGGLFRLSPVEQEVFGLFVRLGTQEYILDLVDDLSGSPRRGRKKPLTFFDCIVRMLNGKPREIAEALLPSGKLEGCGLIEYPTHVNCLELTDKIKSIFSEAGLELRTADLKKELIGQCQTPSLAWSDFGHLGTERELLERLLSGAVKAQSRGINILLHGKPGTGKTEFCRTLARQVGLSLYSVAEQDDRGNEPKRHERMEGLRMLQEILAGDPTAAIMFDEAEDVFGSLRGYCEGPPSKVYMNRMLESSRQPVFWLTNDAASMDRAFLRRMTYCLEMSELPLIVRLAISQKECRRKKLKVNGAELAKMVQEYDLPPGVFSNAVNVASLAGGKLDVVRQVVGASEKILGIRRNLVKPPETFELDLIQADVPLAQIASSIKNSDRRDFSFCLSGPPGTGKSEFARWLARELNMEVLFKRASDLLSKWVGGTEENIAAAFREAEVQQKMLVFDEADSLIYSRREARNSWEVSHVNEMLTWMERHPLPFICTTNLAEKVDDAAFRRFTFKSVFDYLTPKQIELAFRRFFGQVAPTNVLRIECLTPGDFAVVKKKVEYLGGADASEIARMLEMETSVKPCRQNSRRLGFRTA